MTRQTGQDRRTRWHVPDPQLDGYAREQLAPPQAWSVEAHLDGCPTCRGRLAGRLTGPPADAVAASAQALRATPLPAQGRVHRPTAVRQWYLLLVSGPARGGYGAAVLATLLAAGLLDVLSGPVGPAGGAVPLLQLVAPVLPLLGVALSYGPGWDPAHEVVVGTPSGGLRLVLVRTAAALVAAVPAAALLGWATGAGSPALWLLPCLALVAGALAAGPLLGLDRAAAVLGAGWAAAVGVPLLADRVPAVLAPAAALPWTAALAVALAVVVLRRDAYAHLPLPSRAARPHRLPGELS